MKKNIFPLLVIILAGCSNNQSPDYFSTKSKSIRTERIVSDVMDPAPMDYSNRMVEEVSSPSPSSSSVNNPVNIQKQMLIKRANVRFEVKNYDKARTIIAAIIKSANAYVASENESRNDYQISNSLTIRVPQSSFDNLIDSIISQSKNLDERSVTVEDVTEEYVDTDSRLKAKRAIENRYIEILKKAFTVEDILEVEEKLGRIREEIESTQGRLTFLSHQTSLSTINLTFYERKNIIPGQRIGFLSRMYAALANGWNGLIEFLIGIVSAWPVVLILGGFLILIIKLIRHNRKKNSIRM